MKFKLLQEYRSVEVEEQTPDVSRSTGLEIRRVEISFRAGSDLSEALVSEIEDGREAASPVVDDEGGHWIVEHWNRSYQSGSEVERYEILLVQSETLVATELQFLDLTLTLDYYQEDAVDAEPIVIEAEASVTAEQSAQLVSLLNSQEDKYFDLLRKGVSDLPLRVRFGQTLWQDLDGEEARRKYRLIFVSEDEDSDETIPSINEPQLTNISRMLVAATETIAVLLKELQDNGGLSPAAVERLRQQTDGAWDRRWLELQQCSDVTRYRLRQG